MNQGFFCYLIALYSALYPVASEMVLRISQWYRFTEGKGADRVTGDFGWIRALSLQVARLIQVCLSAILG